jgi:segregation and condensation protein B
LLETLSLIAYKQPLTRGDIEEVRGVAVSTNIMRSLLEREWIRVVGHRDVPGRPAMYATTRGFLDYFDLNSLDELPPLAEIRELEPNIEELDLGEDLIQVNSLELGAEESPGELLDEESLEQVSKQVDEIQQNIKRMFNPESDESDESDESNESDEDADHPEQAIVDATARPEKSSQEPVSFVDIPADILNAAFSEDDSSTDTDDEH